MGLLGFQSDTFQGNAFQNDAGLVITPPLPGVGYWVTGPSLRSYLGSGSNPSLAEQTFAQDVADAINASIDWYFSIVPTATDYPLPVTAALVPVVQRAAHIAAARLWKMREAPNGILGISDVTGAAFRVTSDYLTPVWAQLARSHPTGGVVAG